LLILFISFASLIDAFPYCIIDGAYFLFVLHLVIHVTLTKIALYFL